MPRSRRITPPRSYQLEDPSWEQLADSADAVGMSRAELLAVFSRWFNRQSGVTLPQRPSPEAVAEARKRRLAVEAEKERLGIRRRGGAPRRRLAEPEQPRRKESR